MKSIFALLCLFLFTGLSKAQDIEVYCYYQTDEPALSSIPLEEGFSSLFQAEPTDDQFVISEEAFFFALLKCDQKVKGLGEFAGMKGQAIPQNESPLEHKELKVRSSKTMFEPGTNFAADTQNKEHLDRIALYLKFIKLHKEELTSLASSEQLTEPSSLKKQLGDPIDHKKMAPKDAAKLGAIALSKHALYGLSTLATWWYRAPLLVKVTRAAFPLFYQMMHGYVPSPMNPAYYWYYLPARDHACNFAYHHAAEILPVAYVLAYLSYLGLNHTRKALKVGATTAYKNGKAGYELTSKAIKGTGEKISTCKDSIKSIFDDIDEIAKLDFDISI